MGRRRYELEEIAAWPARPLEPLFPIVFFDAPRMKIKCESFVRNTAAYIARSVHANGSNEVLGLWIETNEGGECWLRS